MSLALSAFGRTLRISDETRDHVLVTIWVLVTFKQFRYDELILYPLALYFFWAFIRDFPALFDTLARSLIVWSYPVWFFLTLAWGTETGLILKTGLQLVLTLMICYCAVLRLSARKIIVSVMIAAGWYGLLSAVETDALKYARGVFSSKNAFGAAMVMLFVASLCVMLDRAHRGWLRIVAVAFFMLSIPMIFRSHSATAVLLAAGSFVCVVTLIGRRLLSPIAMVGGGLVLCGLVAGAAGVYAFSITETDPVGYVLDAFDKDVTLTGRTILWDYAAAEIERHPWLGVGHGGFWTPQDPLSVARRIYDEFYKAYYASFSFHNTYYEIAVHQGLIGAGLVVVTSIWLVLAVLPGAVVHQSIGSIYFLCIAVLSLTQSMMEVTLMVPFGLGFMLFVMGGLFGVKRVEASSHAAPRIGRAVAI